MNISSTIKPTRALNTRKELGQKYAHAKDEFEFHTEDHFQRAEQHAKWGSRLSFGAGAAVLATGAVLVTKFAPGLEGYGAAFPPVLAAAGTVGLGMFISNKLLESTLSETKFQESREALVEVRDQYRGELLKEMNDPGVRSITQARWDEVKPSEDIHAPKPTRAELNLLKKVDRLEALADSRIAGGWKQALAEAQDDPVIFERENQTVLNNRGIYTVLKETLGENS